MTSEHDLAGGDDEVLGKLPQDVDGVGGGERVETCRHLVGLQVPGHQQVVHPALLQAGVSQLRVVHHDPEARENSN